GLQSIACREAPNSALRMHPAQQTAARPCVCVVDDDPTVLRSVARLLEAGGFAGRAYVSAEALLQEVQKVDPSCVIADLRLPGLDGLDLQQTLAAAGIVVPMVFISGANDV